MCKWTPRLSMTQSFVWRKQNPIPFLAFSGAVRRASSVLIKASAPLALKLSGLAGLRFVANLRIAGRRPKMNSGKDSNRFKRLLYLSKSSKRAGLSSKSGLFRTLCATNALMVIPFSVCATISCFHWRTSAGERSMALNWAAPSTPQLHLSYYGMNIEHHA